MTWPTATWLALFLSTFAAGPTTAPEPVTRTGSVVLLTEVLKAKGVACDPEPISKQVVIQGDDGTITPILSDDASRAFFLDERLRNRKAEINGRRHPGLPYLQVVSFKVEDHGAFRTPEYFCEICTISMRSPQICPCCQGEMELRMRPEPQ